MKRKDTVCSSKLLPPSALQANSLSVEEQRAVAAEVEALEAALRMTRVADAWVSLGKPANARKVLRRVIDTLTEIVEIHRSKASTGGNAGGMARELAAQKPESPTEQNG